MTDFARQIRLYAAGLAEFLASRKNQKYQTQGSNFLTCCPVHDDNNPSMSIFCDESVRYKCYAGCSDAEIRAEIKSLGYPDPPTPVYGKGKQDWTVNKLIHEPRPSDEWFISTFDRVPDALWTYTDRQGRSVFLVTRFDPVPPAVKKDIRPIVSVTSKVNGTQFWTKGQWDVAKRPLYNLKDIADRTNSPVLIVEGEKTAEAAGYMLPEYVVTTWAGGASAVNNKTDFTSLANREVTIWPDNDEPGIKAAKAIASLLSKGSYRAKSVRLVFDEIRTDFPEGWDLADDHDPIAYPSIEDLLNGAFSLDAKDLPDVPVEIDDIEVLAKKRALLDRYAAIEMRPDVRYIDLTTGSPYNTHIIPFGFYTKNSLEQKEVSAFLELRKGQGPRRRKLVELYFDDPDKIWLSGYVYDPTTDERQVHGKLNLYVGMANPAKPCDPAKYQCFVDHVRASLKPAEAEYFLNWLTCILRYRQMLGTMIVMAGRQGCGKTIVCDIVRKILGPHNAVKIGMKDLVGQFNSQYANKVFIDVEEYNPGGTKDQRELREKVKNLVTSESMIVNPKGIQAYENPCYHSIIATTNSQNPEEISFDNRRMTFLNFDNPGLKMEGRIIHDPDYFEPLVRLADDPEALSGLCDWFMAREAKFGLASKPMSTEMSDEALEFVDSPAHAFLHQLADTGVLPDHTEEPTDEDNPYPLSRWPGHAAALPRHIICDMFYDYCRTERFDRMSHVKASRTIMRVLHPDRRVPRGISDSFNVDHPRPWNIRRLRENDTYIKSSRSICLPDIHELRHRVETMAGSPIKWSIYEDTGANADTVVEFPRKPKTEEPF